MTDERQRICLQIGSPVELEGFPGKWQLSQDHLGGFSRDRGAVDTVHGV